MKFFNLPRTRRGACGVVGRDAKRLRAACPKRPRWAAPAAPRRSQRRFWPWAKGSCNRTTCDAPLTRDRAGSPRLCGRPHPAGPSFAAARAKGVCLARGPAGGKPGQWLASC